MPARPIPMCGVPYHAAEAYLARLIRRGFRVAVAEQMEDPKTRTGKAPIRREVVRLDHPRHHHRGSACSKPAGPTCCSRWRRTSDGIGAAWLDVSTGLFETAALLRAGTPRPARPPGTGGDPRPRHARPGRLGRQARARADRRRRRWSPAAGWRRRSAPPASTRSAASPTARRSPPPWRWTTCAPPRPAPCRASPARRRRAAPGVLAMDAATRASLEIQRARDGGDAAHAARRGAAHADRRRARALLAGWLAAPLTDPAAIAGAAGRLVLAARQSAMRPTRLRAALRAAPDIARALARLSLNRGGPRDLAALRDGLRAARGDAAERRCWMARCPPVSLRSGSRRACASIQRWHATLTAALADPAPHRLDDGNAIRPASTPNSTPNAPCATTAAACWRRCSSTARSATASPA